MVPKLLINVVTSLWLLLASPTESARTTSRTLVEEASSFSGGTYDLAKHVKPNEDITEALAKAWKEACAATSASKIAIPMGTYKVQEIELSGPCKAPITLQHCGTLQAPAKPSEMKGEAWLMIRHIDYFTLDGGGIFDGQGQIAWKENNCAKNPHCKQLPMNFRFDFVKHSVVRDVTSLDSKNFHVNVLGCTNFTFERFTIKAGKNSLNTDGIHIGRSDGIKILNADVETGDDCVSMGDGSRDVTISKLKCGPGHGISIGSLGRYKNEEAVKGIHVKDCTISNTQNGLRIKSWPDLYENTVTDVHFEGIVMENVSNPIILDQEYCPWNQCKAGKASRVKVSDVSFKNIHGTSATPEAVQILCSPGTCQNVELANIDLKYIGDKPADKFVSICKNIKPKISGMLNPKSTTC